LIEFFKSGFSVNLPIGTGNSINKNPENRDDKNSSQQVGIIENNFDMIKYIRVYVVFSINKK
jgi:hypothetical protein